MYGDVNEVIPGCQKRAEHDETWKVDARCGEEQWRDWFPPRFFYPPRGASLVAVKKFCAQCPVQHDCLEYALHHRERHGIWGGTSERERLRILKARRATAAGGGAPTPTPTASPLRTP